MHLCLHSDRIIVDGSKLHLRHVNLTDGGVYQCAAENRYGMIVSATWVQVKGKNMCTYFRLIYKCNHIIHVTAGPLFCKV